MNVDTTNKGCSSFLHWVIAFVVIALAFGLAVAADPPSSVGKVGADFCRDEVVRDYLKPLRRMTPVQPIPPSGHLPFLPKRVSVNVIGSGLRVGRGTIGFALGDEAVNWPRQLNLEIQTTLIKVGATGATHKAVDTKTERIRQRKIDFETVKGQRFTVSGDPAFYRVDIVFRKLKGKKLGSYSKYFRVMQRSYSARLVVDDDVVRPGELVHARLENLGTEGVLPDSLASVEMQNFEGWQEIGSVVAEGLKPKIRAFQFGGIAGPCFSYRVPIGAEPGRHRFKQRLTRYLANGEKRDLYATFSVMSE